GGVTTGSMKSQLAASAAGTSRNMASIPRPTYTAPMIGTKMLAIAILLVNYVMNSKINTATATNMIVGSTTRYATWSPSHAANPVSSNCFDSASPPPNNSRMPHGNCFAVSQSIVRTPLRTGRMNSSTATSMATTLSSAYSSQPMAASPMISSSASNGGTIHATAAPTNTPRAFFSPRDIGPSSSSCWRMSSRPPGSSVSFGRKTTLVSSSQAITRNTIAMGRPNSIHSPKPMLMPCSLR